MEMTSAIRMLVLLEVNDAVYVRSFVERVVPATRMRRNFMCIAWRKFEAEVLSTRKTHPRLRKQEEKRDELDDRGLHGGVSGLARVSHDLLLRLYLDTDESKELGASFRGKRKPDTDTFGH